MSNKDWSHAGKPPLNAVTACILAGGFGTRLRSVLPNTPKALAPIDGAPFLFHLFEKLAAAGINRTVLCTGHLAEKIRDSVGDRFQGMEILYSEEAEPRGTGGALRLALPFFNKPQVLVLNGDSFCDANLVSFLDWHSQKGASASLVLAKVKECSRFGSVTFRADGALESFVEKGSTLGEGWINAGIYLLNHSLIAAMPAGIELSLERKTFPELLGQGLYGYQMEGDGFIDIGTPASYAQAKEFFAHRSQP